MNYIYNLVKVSKKHSIIRIAPYTRNNEKVKDEKKELVSDPR